MLPLSPSSSHHSLKQARGGEALPLVTITEERWQNPPRVMCISFPGLYKEAESDDENGERRGRCGVVAHGAATYDSGGADRSSHSAVGEVIFHP